MKKVGIREFRDHATQYLAADEVLAIERHGRTVGFYIPTGSSREESFALALQRLEDIVERTLVETGMSEEELSRLYDLGQPVPSRRHRKISGEVAQPVHAPGR
ncbi:MAG: hypothetical protein HW416_2777 [Chloroflexi bacterium]|nr:hypothetical protein [Chloroflexota bacterium]